VYNTIYKILLISYNRFLNSLKLGINNNIKPTTKKTNKKDTKTDEDILVSKLSEPVNKFLLNNKIKTMILKNAIKISNIFDRGLIFSNDFTELFELLVELSIILL
jgi:hypothetical protein